MGVSVDPTSGTQTILSEKGLFQDIRGVEIYRGPDTPTPVRSTSWGRLKAIYR